MTFTFFVQYNIDQRWLNYFFGNELNKTDYIKTLIFYQITIFIRLYENNIEGINL